MQVGDLVMWLGKDEWHGMMGVISESGFEYQLARSVVLLMFSGAMEPMQE